MCAEQVTRRPCYLKALGASPNIAQRIQNPPRGCPYDASHVDHAVLDLDATLTKSHMWRFIGVLMLVQIHDRHSDWKHWWSKKVNLAFIQVRRLCSQKEFHHTLRHLHLSDSHRDWRNPARTVPKRGDDAYRADYKLEQWSQLLNHKFGSTYEPGRDLSFDEMMIASLARIAFRVYMRDKPVKRGFKKWATCDAVTSYLLHSTLYTGNAGYDDAPCGVLGETVRAELEKAELLGKGHHVVMDRAFTNLVLLHTLRNDHDTTATGTMNSNRRGWDSDQFMFLGDGNRGDHRFGYYLSTDGVVTTAERWQDSATVNFGSTECPVGPDVGDQTRKRRTKTEKKKQGGDSVETDWFWEPLVRWLYNVLMGGVDNHDQSIAYHNPALRRLRRWWVPVFIRDIGSATANAHIHYRDWQKKWGVPLISAKDFRNEVIEEIIARHGDGVEDHFEKECATVDKCRMSHCHRRSTTGPRSQSGTPEPARASSAASPSSQDEQDQRLTEFIRNNQHRVREAPKVTRMLKGKPGTKTKDGSCVECVRTTFKPKRYVGRNGAGKINTNTDSPAWRNYRAKCRTTWVCTHISCAGNNDKPTYLHPQCVADHENFKRPAATAWMRTTMSTVVESPVKGL